VTAAGDTRPGTGQGIGSGMLTLIAGFRYAEMWASVVLVTDEGEAGPTRGHQLGPASVPTSGCRRHGNGPSGGITKQRLTAFPDVRPKW
jgi:hypothetical protein